MLPFGSSSGRAGADEAVRLQLPFGRAGSSSGLQLFGPFPLPEKFQYPSFPRGEGGFGSEKFNFLHLAELEGGTGGAAP